MQNIVVGISSCLLGEEVRYDGAHKHNSYITKTLGQFFEFRSFCPEVASGLGIPRPPVRLVAEGEQIKCVGVKDADLDVTEAIKNISALQNSWLAEISGYILKKGSPSCGMERVKVYRNGFPQGNGVGLFAEHLKQNFPLLPMEEEGRLGDPGLRENFIQRVFIFNNWQVLNQQRLTPRALMEFHSQHKLIAMSHDQTMARELGRIIAGADKSNIDKTAEHYITWLMRCLTVVATPGNHVNVLQHIQGYLKRKIDADDKAELTETIESYRLGKVPLIVPITLLRHHFRKQPDPFIENSYYMNPHPLELGLLNQI
jgi:uncharacterized protein YbgA (DUF1722 family)/uncharacterized protein YbbK (DUF523 family)